MTVTGAFEYDNSYGVIIKHTTTEGMDTQNPFGYTGREMDRQDLYYYRARYYDPQVQVFLSVDPIGFLARDYNFYRYLECNPLNYLDPYGLSCEGTTTAFGAAGAGIGFFAAGGLALVCDAGTMGACAVTNPAIVGGGTVGGGIAGAATGKFLCESAGAIGSTISDAWGRVFSSSKEEEVVIPASDGAVVEGARYPDQTCPNDVLDKLHDLKNIACNAGLHPLKNGGATRAPKELLDFLTRKPKKIPKLKSQNDCSLLNLRLAAIDACIAARKKVTDECFGGINDEIHQEKMDELIRSRAAVMALKALFGCP